MDRRFLTVLAVSLIFALIVSTIFYRMTAGGKGPAAPVATDTKDIVVAAKPLPVGVTVKPADVRIDKIAIAQYPKGAFSKIEEVIDRPVISNVLMDEPVLEGRLSARGSGLGLAPMIPPGMRAVTVRVTDVAGVAGFVFPGLRVDVLVTGRPPNADSPITSTCLQNMLVLSAGQAIQPDSRGQPIPTPTVTVLATPEQAEKLTLAGNSGSIQLVLRNGSDQTIEKTSGSNIHQLYGEKAKPTPTEAPKVRRVAKVVPAAPPAPPPPPPPPPEVIMIRGNQKSVERVGSGGTN